MKNKKLLLMISILCFSISLSLTTLATGIDENTVKPSIEENKNTLTAEGIKTNSEDNIESTNKSIDESDNSEITMVPYYTSIPENSNISSIFPDPIIAKEISQRLKKDINDTISQQELDSITRIYLGSSGPELTSFEGIQYLNNLTSFSIDGGGSNRGSVSDLSPFKNLSKLTSLQLTSVSVSDISPLNNLNLKSLYLSYTLFTDFSSLNNLSCKNTIRTLSVSTTRLLNYPANISDVNWSEFGNLVTLGLYGNLINNIDCLNSPSLYNLIQLNLSNNQISDISPLSQMTNLDDLSLSDNKIQDISPLYDVINSRRGNYMNFHLNNQKITSPVISIDDRNSELIVKQTVVNYDQTNINLTLSDNGTYDTVDGFSKWGSTKNISALFSSWEVNIQIPPRKVIFSGTIEQPLLSSSTDSSSTESSSTDSSSTESSSTDSSSTESSSTESSSTDSSSTDSSSTESSSTESSSTDSSSTDSSSTESSSTESSSTDSSSTDSSSTESSSTVLVNTTNSYESYTNSIGKTTPTKSASTTEELPQTGETKSPLLTVIGSITLLASGAYVLNLTHKKSN